MANIRYGLCKHWKMLAKEGSDTLSAKFADYVIILMIIQEKKGKNALKLAAVSKAICITYCIF